MPAQYAMKVQRKLSGGYWSRLYMPMDAATSGTLSITALTRPSSSTMTFIRLDALAEPSRQRCKDIRVLQNGDRQQDACERNQRTQVNPLKRAHQGQALCLKKLLLP